MDDEPMWAADRVVALTPGSAIIIPETAIEFAIKDCVMSSSSTVTYTSVYTDFEPGRVFWGADEELSDGGLEEDPEDPEEDPEEDHDDEPFEDEDDDEEEEEHLALADSSTVLLLDPVPFQVGDTKDFELMSIHLTQITAGISSYHTTTSTIIIHLPPPIPTSLPLPLSPLPPLPTLLSIPPPVNRREDIPEVELPPHKRLCLTTLTLRYEVGESLTAAPRPTGDPAEAVEEVAPTTPEGVNATVTELAVVQEQDTQDIYTVIEDGQDRQTQLSQRGQLSVALGQIQARDQTHADDPEGAGSSA
ncbi:hypothetical protein Tco_0458319 [Tanacetum coccineum]